MIDDRLITPILDEMLECVRETFEAHSSPPGVIRHHVGNGISVPQLDPNARPVRNECCEGLAWVRLASFYPTATPQLTPETNIDNCLLGWAVQVELGAVRCWPGAGKFATPEMWSDTMALVCEDAAALRRALICCWRPEHENVKFAMGVWRPLGVTGQCVGGVLPVTFNPFTADRVDCCPPPDESP